MTNNLEIADSKTITNRIKGLKNLLAVLPKKGQIERNAHNPLIKFGASAYTSSDTIVLPLALMMQKNYDRAEVIALLAHELGHQFFTAGINFNADNLQLEVERQLDRYAKVDGAHDFRNVVEDLKIDYLSNETIPNSKTLTEYQLIKTISDKNYLESARNADNVNLTGLVFIYEGYNLIFPNAIVQKLVNELKAELFKRAELLHIPSELKDLESDYEDIVEKLKLMLGNLENNVKKSLKTEFYTVSSTILETKAIIIFYEKYFVLNLKQSVAQGAGDHQDQDQKEQSSGQNRNSDSQNSANSDNSSNEDNSNKSDNSSQEDDSDKPDGSSDEQNDSNREGKQSSSKSDGDSENDEPDDSDGQGASSDGEDDSDQQKTQGSSVSKGDSNNDDPNDSDELGDSSDGENNTDSDTQNSDSDGNGANPVKALSDIREQILNKLFEQSEEIMDNKNDLSKTHQNIIDTLEAGFKFTGEKEYVSEKIDGTLSFNLVKAENKKELTVSDREAIKKLFMAADNQKEAPTNNLHPENYWEWLERKAFKESMNLLGKLKQALNAYKPKYFTSPCKCGFKLNKAQLHNIAAGQYVNKPFSVKEKGIDLSTEIVFLTDVSSSMRGDRTDRVNETILVLCEALKKVGNNLKVSIAAYDDYVHSVKKSYEPFSVIKTNMPDVSGCTDGESAMKWALKSLKTSRAHRKIIICLTDGIWDSVKSKDHYDLIRKAGIETYGLGYMTEKTLKSHIESSDLPYFDKWFRVGDDLKEFYLKFLTELLAVAPH